MNHRLTISAGPDAGARFDLTDVLLIGRGDACGVKLSDPGVSREHCLVTLADGKVLLEDAGSRWGTQVNGEKIDSLELAPGDVIMVGDTRLTFDLAAEEQETLLPTGRRDPEDIAPHPPFPSSPDQAADTNDAQATEDKRTPKNRPNPPKVGDSFLRYRIKSEIAKSQNGTVFLAHDREKDRQVALKVFSPETFADESTMQRFIRAMKTMLPHKHEHLVRLYAAGKTDGLCYTVSEYVEGESVSSMIERVGVAGMLEWRQAYHVALGVAEALEFAHEQNIVHRNLKPGNVLIRKSDDCVKLGDLMYARALGEGGGERITKPGEVVGDVCYLSPEQVSGETDIDARADIYSLGAMLYAILTGRPPFEGKPVDVIRCVLTEDPEPPTKHHLSIPGAFEGVVMQMLAKRPQDRYPSTMALLKDLRRVGKYQGIG